MTGLHFYQVENHKNLFFRLFSFYKRTDTRKASVVNPRQNKKGSGVTTLRESVAVYEFKTLIKVQKSNK